MPARFYRGETTGEQGRGQDWKDAGIPFLFLLRFPLELPFLISFSILSALGSSISYALTKLIIVTEERLVESNLFIDGSAIR